MAKLKDLPHELIELAKLRYSQQYKLTCPHPSNFPSEKYEYDIMSLFSFRETPENTLDEHFWYKVARFTPDKYILIKQSRAYPKHDGAFDSSKIDKQISEIEFYEKYWI